jgi:hypothetical protein
MLVTAPLLVTLLVLAKVLAVGSKVMDNKVERWNPPNWYSKNEVPGGGNPRFYSEQGQGTTNRATPKDRKGKATSNPKAGRIM